MTTETLILNSSQPLVIGGGGDDDDDQTTTLFEPITLSWENVRVIVPAKKSFLCFRKAKPAVDILKGVSGIVQPGTLLAIMGASGSGKTTLLNVLTQRNLQKLEFSGSVKVNGVKVGPAIASISAYVQQEDLFVGVLTVRQHLWFQAMLRMDPNKKMTNETRQQRIAQVIRDLGLTTCQHQIIGVPNKVKSLSGGERKRLAFASEILTNPALMFCDEPTSGLDSFMAESVVNTLKTLASSGRTIVCTIHQPSSEIFALFDNLLLLAEGRIVYMGSSFGARSFFASAGFNCPVDFNPADFYIRTLAIAPGKEDASRQRLDKIYATFMSSEIGKTLSSQVADASKVPSDKIAFTKNLLETSVKSRFKATYFTQLRLVGWRSFMSSNRDTAVIQLRFFQNLIISLISGLVFLNQNYDQKGVQNMNGALFMMCANMTFGNMGQVILLFTSEMPLFKRDHENGAYRTSVYYLCKSLADMPIFIINPIIYITIMYWMTGLRADVFAFLLCVGTAILLTQIVIAFGTMISCIGGTTKVAQALTGPIMIPFVLFGGFLLNDASIPKYFLWMSHLSWVKYANEIYLVNQWHNFGEIACELMMNMNATTTTIIKKRGGAGSDATVHLSNTTSSLVAGRCFKDGDSILEAFSYSPDNMLRNFLCLIALLIGFRLVGYLALYLRINPVKLSCCRDRRRKTSTTNNNDINI